MDLGYPEMTPPSRIFWEALAGRQSAGVEKVGDNFVEPLVTGFMCFRTLPTSSSRVGGNHAPRYRWDRLKPGHHARASASFPA